MKALASSVVKAIAFLQLSGDDVVDLDAAVAVTEMLCAILRDADPAEMAALREAVAAELCRRAANNASHEELEYFQTFLTNAGLE